MEGGHPLLPHPVHLEVAHISDVHHPVLSDQVQTPYLLIMSHRVARVTRGSQPAHVWRYQGLIVKKNNCYLVMRERTLCAV